MRIAVLEPGKPDLLDVFLGNGLAFGFRDAAHFQPEGHVAHHAGPGQQREILKHEGAVRAGAGDGLAVDLDLARGRLQQPRDDLQKRGLATARRPQQRGQLAARKLQRQIAQRFDVAIVLRDVAAPKPRFRISRFDLLEGCV